MTTRISINGVIDDEQATISVLDRGFLYGDSVYEVTRTYNRLPWALDEHLERLERSARVLHIPTPPRALLVEELEATLAAASNRESYIRLVITRGAGPIGLDLSLASAPSRVIIVTPTRGHPDALYRDGAHVVLVPSAGRSSAAVSRGAKSGNYLPNILALSKAKARGAHEALLLDENGFLTEGASSNVFALFGDALRTPPTQGILEGITRRHVIALARAQGLSVREAPIAATALKTAREVMLTSTLREVMPVTRIDDDTVGDGAPGDVTERLRAAYHEMIRGARA